MTRASTTTAATFASTTTAATFASTTTAATFASTTTAVLPPSLPDADALTLPTEVAR